MTPFLFAATEYLATAKKQMNPAGFGSPTAYAQTRSNTQNFPECPYSTQQPLPPPAEKLMVLYETLIRYAHFRLDEWMKGGNIIPNDLNDWTTKLNSLIESTHPNQDALVSFRNKHTSIQLFRLLNKCISQNGQNPNAHPIIDDSIIKKLIDVIQLIRAKVLTWVDDTNHSPLQQAIIANRPAIAIKLLQIYSQDLDILEAMVNAPKNQLSRSPLTLAMQQGNANMIAQLVEYGANTLDYHAFFYGIENGQHGLVQQMLEFGTNPNVEFQGLTPLQLAFKKMDWKMEKLLVKNGAKAPDPTAVIAAAIQILDIEMVRYVLEQGANPNAVELRSQKPLLQLVCDARADLPADQIWKRLEIALLLIQHGADPNREGRFRQPISSNYHSLGIQGTFFRVLYRIKQQTQKGISNVEDLLPTIYDLLNQKTPHLEYIAIRLILKECYATSMEMFLYGCILHSGDKVLTGGLVSLIHLNQLDEDLLKEPDIASFLEAQKAFQKENRSQS